jgi:hypothetical protein
MDARTKQQLDKLFEPIMIKDVELRNRIKISAMAVAMTDEAGNVSDEMVAFYEERARGGGRPDRYQLFRDGAGSRSDDRVAS